MTKVRNTIVCKADIRREKRRKDYKRARPYQSDRLPELIIGFIDLQCYSNLQNEYYL